MKQDEDEVKKKWIRIEDEMWKKWKIKWNRIESKISHLFLDFFKRFWINTSSAAQKVENGMLLLQVSARTNDLPQVVFKTFKT